MIEYKTLDIDGPWNKMDSRDIDFKKIVPRFQVKNIIKKFSCFFGLFFARGGRIFEQGFTSY
jgi:hypothetical protein